MTTVAQTGERLYFPALDGLRFVCCVAVIFSHTYPSHPVIGDWATRVGVMGVRVFFALSGFLITTLLLREISERGRADLKAFYLRRVLRIFPVYYFALAVAFGGMLLLGDLYTRPLGVAMDAIPMGLAAVLYPLFLANWVHMSVPGPLGVLWSISVEEQFYLLFPATFFRSAKKAAALRPIVAGLLLSVAVRIYLARVNPVLLDTNTFALGDHLLLGALLAQGLHIDPERVKRIVRSLGTTGEIAVLAGIGALAAYVPQSRAGFVLSGWVSALLSVSIVALIATKAGLVSRLLERRAPRKLGQLTYSAYVFHIYGIAAAWLVTRPIDAGLELTLLLRLTLATVLTFAIAWAIRVAFEERALRLKERLVRVPAGDAQLAA